MNEIMLKSFCFINSSIYVLLGYVNCVYLKALRSIFKQIRIHVHEEAFYISIIDGFDLLLDRK